MSSNWQDKPAKAIQVAMINALTNRDTGSLTRGKATSIVRNKLRKMNKKQTKRNAN